MYKKRIIDKKIETLLDAPIAIQIVGPKWCGKTTTGKQFSQSFIDFQDETNKQRYKLLAENNIKLLLEGDKPRLIDEWQEIKAIWNAVRRSVDDSPSNKLEYILTGSVIPPSKEGLHTGTGRFLSLTMKTMSLFESGESTGEVSLASLLDENVNVSAISPLTYSDLAYITCRGGWPRTINLPKEIALEIAKSYVDEVCNKDISVYDGVNRNANLAKAILKAYARHTSTINSDKTLFKDIRSIYGEVSNPTIYEYLEVLKNLYIIDEIAAWNPNIRSKTAIAASSKKSFIDPSIGAAALNCSPKELEFDPETFGLLFENLVARDLSIYISNTGGYLRHYRDRYGVECDTIVHFANGEYGLVQAKLGSSKEEEAIDAMIKIYELIKRNIEENPKDKTLRLPSFMLVVTGGGYAYKVANKGYDNIYVVPLGCLKD